MHLLLRFGTLFAEVSRQHCAFSGSLRNMQGISAAFQSFMLAS